MLSTTLPVTAVFATTSPHRVLGHRTTGLSAQEPLPGRRVEHSRRKATRPQWIARRREPNPDAPAPSLGVFGAVAAAELQRLDEPVATRAREPATRLRRRRSPAAHENKPIVQCLRPILATGAGRDADPRAQPLEERSRSELAVHQPTRDTHPALRGARGRTRVDSPRHDYDASPVIGRRPLTPSIVHHLRAIALGFGVTSPVVRRLDCRAP